MERGHAYYIMQREMEATDECTLMWHSGNGKLWICDAGAHVLKLRTWALSLHPLLRWIQPLSHPVLDLSSLTLSPLLQWTGVLRFTLLCCIYLSSESLPSRSHAGLGPSSLTPSTVACTGSELSPPVLGLISYSVPSHTIDLSSLTPSLLPYPVPLHVYILF